ncbi:NAD(P)-dependent oxidoreductase [Flammeovirga kamogawensis]|uniref:NAD(P)-dependent oxidoreductase n=1 Tax=Flammeovirga kamogawensis TaxID=373891 RepID=A0ABX8GZN1_9BACT|nr:NAD(P)-dependent oxidoreductase [Flammeovirga kamogawensis]MBB6459068.1 alanine dehydrogenase [Flammeovirga kamogawensis]QWG08637.1 NAD(P)-dependent oxidoreductase [Flammeovirga kamogawensis]TRX66930.1 alanine dehydrogenase [Flammeovirga kamogawensis]
MKVGIIKEGKVPQDKRVALTPAQCEEVLEKYPNVEIYVQKSPIRCYEDKEYEEMGIAVVDSVEDCDILLGIKEVPIKELIPNKKYFFFSHTIKKQPYNRELLNAILDNNISIADYEVLTKEDGSRVIAFGRFAGLVGAYNGLLAYGKRHKSFDLKPAHLCHDLNELWIECKKVKLPSDFKIVLTGSGRVSNGAVETLLAAGVKKVSKEDYLNQTFDYPVFVQLRSKDYHEKKDGTAFEIKDFFANPGDFKSTFTDFIPVSNMLVAGAFWHPAAPVLFTREDILKDDFKIEVIADVTCDIEGSIPSTLQPSTIADPLYDYNPVTGKVEKALSNDKNITVMAVDNLPNELPRDASESFGRQMIDNVLEDLFVTNKGVVSGATITENKKLTDKFSYLQGYVDGKE